MAAGDHPSTQGLPSDIPVTVAEGGTGSPTAAAARTALGLAIGSDVEAYNANLAGIDQDVSSGASPTFDGTNITGIGGSTITMPSVVGSRWTEQGLFAGLVVAEHDMATVSDLVTSPGDGAWQNEGASKSAAPLSNAEIASSVIVLQHDGATADSWWSGTYTAPFYYWDLNLTSGDGFLFQAHIALPTAAATSAIKMLAVDSTTAANWIGPELRSGAPNHALVAVGPASTQSALTAPTDGELTTGFWFRITVNADNDVSFWYRKAAAGTPPTENQWTFWRENGAYFATNPHTIRVGFVVDGLGGASWQISGLRIGLPGLVTIT